MKTSEVTSLLSINRETLRYYEQQELIYPMKGENGYRNYDQTDIDTLQLILYLRDLEVSLTKIKLLLTDQLSLYDCLIKRESEILEELTRKKRTLEKIQMNLCRRRMYFFYKEIPEEYKEENILLFNNHNISIQRTDSKTNIIDTELIHYEDINKIEISICTRFDIIYKKNEPNFHKLKLKEYAFGQGGAFMPNYYFHIDFNIYYKQQVLKFESLNLSSMKFIFPLLQKYNIEINDPIGIIPIFNKYDDKLTFVNTIERNIRKWEKEFNIDNPRMESMSVALKELWKIMNSIPSLMLQEKSEE